MEPPLDSMLVDVLTDITQNDPTKGDSMELNVIYNDQFIQIIIWTNLVYT